MTQLLSLGVPFYNDGPAFLPFNAIIPCLEAIPDMDLEIMCVDDDSTDATLELIVQMIAAWRAGTEVVLARRSDRSADSVLKRKTAAWFYHLHNRVSQTKIPENVGDFRLMDLEVAGQIRTPG